MSLPDWLQAHLTQTGAANPDGVSTAARLTRCRDCRAEVLVGLDADRAAGVAVAEPTEIDTSGELLALALGLASFTLIRTVASSGRSTWNLNPRSRWSIEAGRSLRPMVAAHRCGIAVPPTANPILKERKKVSNVPDF